MSARLPEGVTANRRRVGLYLGLTFVISAAVQIRIFSLGGAIADHVPEVFALMWTPALASVICRLVFREGFSDVSFRIGRAGGARPWLWAWLAPLVVGGIAYGGAWLSGLETFAAPEHSSVTALEGMEPVPRFLAAIVLTLFLGAPLAAITATGEEIGWRGYMLTRLVDAGVPHPLLVSGFVWGVWHLPLILSGQYAAGPYPVLSASMFMVGILAAGVLIGYARLETGSVWAAVLFHAAWNATIQGPFDRFTVGAGESVTQSIWIGESGILVVLVHVLLVAWIVRGGIRMRAGPKDEPRTLAVSEL